ncbi:family 43 glycosylhydrolase [Devosia sp.]|uniref:family 43 glycosylhydrolase n=1 Tax=Devosia sp. TaxID=1871048 RepID=UPI002AFF5FBD|nr:family 43 glycosylhydrolase [Devosia sp.]
MCNPRLAARWDAGTIVMEMQGMDDHPRKTWAKGPEGQRKADLQDGTFLNPILAGDHPDPSILRDGDDFYMTFSSFETYPGLLIWHSRDLLSWRPLNAALTRNIGSVWAPELVRHEGRYFIYFPTKANAAPGSRSTNWVIWADDIAGPWSDPIDLHLTGHIDPGHAVGEDGSRWLFLSKGDRVRLSPDGLSTLGAVEHVYDGWRYPEDWDVEAYAQEGPKVTRRGEYFYLVSAVGGTAGPPTGHMVIVARARSIHGPWQNHPRNPVVRTRSLAEKWWSRGHATLVSTPDGQYWALYHGYENGFWTLGRQTLLAPVSWSDDGWPEFGGGDLSTPLLAPLPASPGHPGLPLSDNFAEDRYGVQWSFFNPAPDEKSRLKVGDRALVLQGRGASPADSSPLTLVAGDLAYEIECQIELSPDCCAGLLLFYDHQLYCGLGATQDHFITHQYGQSRARLAHAYGRQLFIRLRNDRHNVSLYTSGDGLNWARFDRGMEVSGYHHNVRNGFHALRPALYAAGTGEAIFRNFTYRALACEAPVDGPALKGRAP